MKINCLKALLAFSLILISIVSAAPPGAVGSSCTYDYECGQAMTCGFNNHCIGEYDSLDYLPITGGAFVGLQDTNAFIPPPKPGQPLDAASAVVGALLLVAAYGLAWSKSRIGKRARK